MNGRQLRNVEYGVWVKLSSIRLAYIKNRARRYGVEPEEIRI